MAARLPTVGGDDGNWGTVLNDFLSVELNGDGTLKKAGDISTALSNAQTALSTAQSAQSTAEDAQDAAEGAMPAGGAVSITRNGSGQVTAFTQGTVTVDQITYNGGIVTSFRENGATRSITRDSAGRVTAVS